MPPCSPCRPRATRPHRPHRQLGRLARLFHPAARSRPCGPASRLRHPAGPGARRAVPRAPSRARGAFPTVFVKRLAAGERISYGLRTVLDRDTHRRHPAPRAMPTAFAPAIGLGGAVLIGGRRRPIVGVMTMDQLMVDCGDDAVGVVDEVVLIGSPGRASGQRRRLGRGWAPSRTRSPRGIGGRAPRIHRLRSRPRRERLPERSETPPQCSAAGEGVND